MGIRGLTTYIERNTKDFLEPFKLRDTFLVIDGNNLASHIYKWICKSSSSYGGDYDEYYYQVTKFFTGLVMCKVVPVVIFDGGYEERKLDTVKSRLKKKLSTIKNLRSIIYSGQKFFPIFMKNVFLNVLKSLNICHAQTDFEADQEIASVARILQCPVLSYDSDFFVYDVLYIPFATMFWEPAHDEYGHFMNCSVYSIDKFFNQFHGLNRSKLPIISVLLGNDYVNYKIVEKFMSHVHIPKNKNETPSSSKVLAILNWLKNESVESATDRILSHVRKTDGEKIKKEIHESFKTYECKTSHIFETLKLTHIETPKCQTKDYFTDCFVKLARACVLPTFMIDMITLNTYFISPQVEDVKQTTCHDLAAPIYIAIYQILKSGVEVLPDLIIYTRYQSRLKTVKLSIDKLPYLKLYDNFDVIYNLESKMKRDIIYEILKFNESDVELLSSLPQNWHLYFISVIYWAKNKNSDYLILYTMVWSVLCLNLVQTKLGYYSSHSKFLQHRGGYLKKNLKQYGSILNSTSNVAENNNMNIVELISLVPEEELVLLASQYISLRTSTEKHPSIKDFDTSLIHILAEFQSCLYHLSCLNSLLNFPFCSINVENFFSGTLFYCSYTFFKKNGVKDGINSVLKVTPILFQLFNRIVELLSPFFTHCKNVTRRKRRRRTKRRNSENNESESVSDNTDSNESVFVDENNRFAYLGIND